MPIIPLDLDQSLPRKEFYQSMFAQVMAVMAYPKSEENRKKLLHTYASNRLLPQNVPSLIRTNANPDFKFNLNRSLEEKLQTVGQVLNWFLVLYCDSDFKKKASIRLACRIITVELRLRNQWDKGKEYLGLKAGALSDLNPDELRQYLEWYENNETTYPGEDKITKAWKGFKSVAHFWAQYNMTISCISPRDETVQDFMVGAEFRRMAVEKIKPYRAKQTVLDAATTWRLPHPIPTWRNDTATLQIVKNLTLPPLTSWHRKIIAD